MKLQKIKIYCQTKDCDNCREIEWKGEYIEKWICPQCLNKIMEKK